jgi:hypothetical protein
MQPVHRGAGNTNQSNHFHTARGVDPGTADADAGFDGRPAQ